MNDVRYCFPLGEFKQCMPAKIKISQRFDANWDPVSFGTSLTRVPDSLALARCSCDGFYLFWQFVGRLCVRQPKERNISCVVKALGRWHFVQKKYESKSLRRPRWYYEDPNQHRGMASDVVLELTSLTASLTTIQRIWRPYYRLSSKRSLWLEAGKWFPSACRRSEFILCAKCV